MTPNERLAFLATALEQNAEDPKGMKFDLSFWIAKDNRRPEDAPIGHHRDCGTVGCAIGLATIIPEFNAEGFSSSFSSTHEAFIPEYITGSVDSEWKVSYQFNAVSNFFGLDRDMAQKLFHPSHYAVKIGAEAEREVARRIRQYLVTQEGSP